MRIDQRIQDDVVIIEPRGRLTVETETALTDTVRRLLDDGKRRLVLSLADVPYIDSCGLGAIVHAYVSAGRRGGDLKLIELTDRHRHLLSITKLLTVLEAYDSEEDAVRSYHDGSPRSVLLTAGVGAGRRQAPSFMVRTRS
jgi:anti-sigma B factor antagonist